MKPAALIQLAFIVLAGVAVYAFVSMARDAETRRACIPMCLMRPNYAGRNRTAPDFELESNEGGKVRLSDFRGKKMVVLNFWTTTCQPCLEEMPSLAEFTRLAAKKDIVVLTVTIDPEKETAMSALRTLLKEEKPPFRVLFDPESNIVKGKYGTVLFPETWIIDRAGVIRARFDNGRDWSNDPLVLDLIESFERPASCDIEFDSRKPSGPEAPICDESGSG
jgi:peroxiredoxin